VVRTVSTLPGVAVNNAGGRNDLLVRGGGPSENLYIINGIEVPNINHFGGQGYKFRQSQFCQSGFCSGRHILHRRFQRPLWR